MTDHQNSRFDKISYYVMFDKYDKRMANSHDVVLQLPHSIAAMEDSENSQLQSSPEMYSLSIKETQGVMSIVGREIQLTKDYTTGNATFKQGSRGTVIEATSRKDGKLKVKLDNNNTKTFRLIKECDLQLYEGVALSHLTLNHRQRNNLLNTK